MTTSRNKYSRNYHRNANLGVHTMYLYSALFVFELSQYLLAYWHTFSLFNSIHLFVDDIYGKKIPYTKEEKGSISELGLHVLNRSEP